MIYHEKSQLNRLVWGSLTLAPNIMSVTRKNCHFTAVSSPFMRQLGDIVMVEENSLP